MDSTTPQDPPVESEFQAALAAFLVPFRNFGRVLDAGLDVARDATLPLWNWWATQPFLRNRAPKILAAVLCLWYFVVFERAVWLRHSHFGTFDYDLGMYDQGIWQLAHGRGFMTVRGMHVLGHHANIGYLLLVPFYWIGIGGPQFLDVVNTLAVVAVALPVFALAVRHLKSSWAGFWLVVAYLFHFSPQWKIQETFHAESIAAPFLLGAFYFASVGKWRRYAVCVVLAVIWKEDIAIAAAMLGIGVAIAFRQVRIGAITVAASAAWFLIATQAVMRYFAPAGAVFDSLFGPLGATATDVAFTSLRHPSRLAATVRCHGFFDGRLESLSTPLEGVSCPTEVINDPNGPPRGLGALMAPYGYTAIGAPHLSALGVPQHVVNSATTADFTWDLRWHYAFMPYIGVMLGSFWTAIKRRRLAIAWALIAVMVLGVFITREEGVGPWTANYNAGWWPLTSAKVHRDYQAVVDAIPDDASVTASYFLVPHLSHREHVYTFPNPWRSSNYGAGGTSTPLPDQNSVDRVVVDRAPLNEADRQLFDRIMESDQFETVSRTTRTDDGRMSDVIHLRRIADGPPISDVAIEPPIPTTTVASPPDR